MTTGSDQALRTVCGEGTERSKKPYFVDPCNRSGSLYIHARWADIVVDAQTK